MIPGCALTFTAQPDPMNCANAQKNCFALLVTPYTVDHLTSVLS
ncbi:MAG: hypothetical protein QOC66_4428 [Pseudonocardiales bacterium]|nr:hypothetical protein [Pseudonocardiales bacterium]